VLKIYGRWLWYWRVWQHVFRVLRHKWFVMLAVHRLPFGIPSISMWQVIAHDWSKFSKIERRGYTWQFFGKGDFGEMWVDQHQQNEWWKDALRHHYRSNPHHWQYWCDEHYDNPVPMPERYVREMVADWMAASRTYNGAWPQGVWPWLEKNWWRMKLHPHTRMQVISLVTSLGVNIPPFPGER
jgi:hypothetical protein